MGRRAKPTSLKVANGTARGRDALRFDTVPSAGAPLRPTDLAPIGMELWDRITAEHASRGTLGEVDTSALAAFCRTWELCQAAYAVAKAAPIDKDARVSYLGYLAACDKLGAKFGWTASDRANLKIGGGESKPKIPTRNRTA